MIRFNSDMRLIDLPGVSVGHYSDSIAQTGCTVVMFDKSSTASVCVTGGAPGTQETDLLDPSCLVAGVDAILLTGGSAFGLEAAGGVRRYLEEKGRGFNAAGKLVPIVPAAVIFDLATGDGAIRPGLKEGYKACLNSESPSREEGPVGAGTGACVGKYMGLDKCAKGGLASRVLTMKSGVSVGAIMVANCYGAVTDPRSGKMIAGPKGDTGEPVHYLEAEPPEPQFGSTAIGVVVTDAYLSKADAKRVAIMAQDGLARTVAPSHTPYDGDTIFVVSTGEKKESVSKIGAFSAYLVEQCMVAAVS